MQFRKLRRFSNLINVQRQCHCHQRYHRQHQHQHQHHHHQHYPQHHHACNNWNLLTFITVLITFMSVALATIPINSAANSLQSYAYSSQRKSAENLDNVLKMTIDKSANDDQNSSDDFQRILLAQLKRESKEELNVSNAAGDYNTAADVQRKTLSRKRRYLLFPEGSSFQLVYDGIVGIVDYTNYLILGITVALAWELPNKAPSEMLEDIRTRLDDGTLLLPRNDTITNITYVETKKQKQKTPNNIKKTYKNERPYNNYYQPNKRPLFQPVFIPPMHRNYYHQSQSKSPYNYYRKNPGTSTKYAYYFQPKVKNYGARPYNYGKEQLSDWRRKDNYYYYNNNKNVSRKPMHPFTKWHPAKSYASTFSDNTYSKYPWWNLASRLTNSLRQGTAAQKMRPEMIATSRQFNNINNNNDNMRIWQQNEEEEEEKSSNGYYQSNAPTTKKMKTTSAPPMQRKHYIYPVFGKRSLPDNQQQREPHEQPHIHQQRQQEEQRNHQYEHQHQQPRHRRRCGIDNVELSKFDRIHIRHHRRTRHTLYEKIEKYLDKRGSHGHHCVLRALCETGQKSNEIEPGTFLGELMRTLFTIPEPIEEDLQRLEYKESRYDAAHAFTGNCATRYFHCKDSLWESHFLA